MSVEKINAELKQTLALLKQEKKADLEYYKNKVSGTSFKERRKQGVCWYPVQLERTRFNSAERLIVKVTRNREHRESNLFQSGKLVSLFASGGDFDEKSNHCHGVVNRVTDSDMVITINKDRLPDWVNHGFLGVQLLFDENSYKEMEFALNRVIEGEGRIKELKNILLGSWQARFEEQHPVLNPILNDSQNNALNKILSSKDLAIVHGPPGTGKTTTLVQSIIHVLKSEKQVLVTAPSNAAVDLLVEKLSEQGASVVRIGHPARVTEEIHERTLDAQIANHKDFKQLKDIKKKADEFFRLGGKFKRNFGAKEREQRKLLIDEAKSLRDEADQLSFYITNDILKNAQVVACTLVGANNPKIKGMTFRTAFIDEAAQSLEPASWIPILKSDRVVLAGDHFQLPPTIKSHEAAKAGLEKTLFEKAINRNSADEMLAEQYRMNEKIMAFSNEIFYKNKLVANDKVKGWTVFDGDLSVEFLDTAGAGFFEQVDKETRSTYNNEEADLVFKHLSLYLESINEQDLDIPSVAIISPYKAQVNLLNELLDANEDLKKLRGRNFSVNTIDSFQGQERDVVYISLVRCNENAKIGFLTDYRRLNVAITRARKKLVIIGDSATIGSDSFYNAFIDYTHMIEAYRSAFEILY